MKAAAQGLINTGVLLFVMAFGSQSYASVALGDLLDARRSIVQLNANEENTRRVIDKNTSSIENLNKKIAKINIEEQLTESNIRKNQDGMDEFPEQIDRFQDTIRKLSTQRVGLIKQRKKHLSNISELQDKNIDLSIIGRKYKIDAASESSNLENLKRSYLDKQVSDVINKAQEGRVVTETQQMTCPFSQVYGKEVGEFKGDKSECLRLAVEKAKRSAADKYSPTNITSEIESRNFEITAESSSQYYSVDIEMIKEFKSESWNKTNYEADRVEAQFKGKFRITPTFTNKTRLKLKERFTVKLNGQLSQVTAMDVPNTAPTVRSTTPQVNLQHELEQLKNDRLEAERQRDLERQAEEARVKAEIARRQQEEQGLLSDRAAKQVQEDTFIPPVF